MLSISGLDPRLSTHIAGWKAQGMQHYHPDEVTVTLSETQLLLIFFFYYYFFCSSVLITEALLLSRVGLDTSRNAGQLS